MKKLFILLLVTGVVVLLPFHGVQTTEQKNVSRFAADHFIVKMKKSVDVLAASNPGMSLYEQRIKNLLGSLNVEVKSTKLLFPRDNRKNFMLYSKYELETYHVIYFEGKQDIPSLTEQISKNNEVDFSEPDFIGESAGVKGSNLNISSAPNDQFFNRQWGLSNDGSQKTSTGRTGRRNADMNILKAWEITTGSEEIVVGILDSGTKIDHPDLSGRIWVNTEEVKNGRDDDGNGFVDDINGYNFAYDNSNVKDDGGHGTNIAGTVGASTNNSLGYAGIDQKCRLMVCKNLDDENLGEYSWWAASLYYAANNGARIINMSEGGYDYSKTLENAINFAYEAGSLIVASMMNKNNGDTYYPASFKNVLAVGATDTDDNRCREFTWGGGSNWGKHIAVVAPGNRVYGLDFKDNYNYEVYWSGTSQATAYVSGFASVLLAQDPSRTNKDLREIITSTAQDQVGDPREDKSGWDEYYGYGRVDLYEALNYGKFSSGKKEVREKVKEEEKYEDPVYKDEEPPVRIDDNSDSNSTRAKANDPQDSYRKNRDDNSENKRAKKPKADER
ncbi:MAG: S8 family serine peptidase [Ignavibacteria bacterium]|nr:S8 family serine peptidase [Ignavibacteria bacterium]